MASGPPVEGNRTLVITSQRGQVYPFEAAAKLEAYQTGAKPAPQQVRITLHACYV